MSQKNLRKIITFEESTLGSTNGVGLVVVSSIGVTTIGSLGSMMATLSSKFTFRRFMVTLTLFGFRADVDGFEVIFLFFPLLWVSRG